MNNNQVVAKVGDREITRREVEEVLRHVDRKVAAQFAGPDGIKKLVTQMAQQELFYLDAKEKGLDKDDAFIKEFEKTKEAMLRKYAIDKFLSAIVVSEDEMQKFYEQNKQGYVQPETVKASHILVKDEETANEIIFQLEDGMNFEDAAKKYSLCPSKERGGDLGFFARGRMVPEFEEAAFALEKDEVTKKPVKTQFGYHIIKRTGRREAMQLSFAEAKDMVKKQLILRKQEEIYFGKVEELQNKYKIQMFI